MREELIKKEPTRIVIKGGKDKNKLMKAFEMSEELNNIEEKGTWRVGITTYSQLIIDIDNQNQENLKHIIQELEILFDDEDFTVIKTCHENSEQFGYQIIGNEKSKSSFVYKHLKVLNFRLNRNFEEITNFKTWLETFLNEFREKYPNPKKNQFNEELLKSGLINPIGDFDYLYNVLAAINGKVSIRLTPKTPKDKWEVININKQE